MRKYKRGSQSQDQPLVMQQLVWDHASLFAHWRLGTAATFVYGSGEPRGSRTVLREAGDEISPPYSPAINRDLTARAASLMGDINVEWVNPSREWYIR